MCTSRKEFIKQLGLGTAALTFGGTATGFSAKSYSQIMGANRRVHFAVVGLHNRGRAHVKAIAQNKNTAIDYICDVDSDVAKDGAELVQKQTQKKPQIYEDFRDLITEKELDAVTIATPDHLHAPFTIMATKAGKHVYVEKPCCYNLQEGQWLRELSKKYDNAIQMGTQGRSSPRVITGVGDIQSGIIGEVYFAKAWYANKRGSIGTGKIIPVPDRLNWNLFQGVAPRRPYKDNIVPYNWHWFKPWGTGEINNNGIHQLDVCRWALEVDYPEQVSSYGGRYHFNDDWEFTDSQVATFKYANGRQLTWEGRSCNPFRKYNRPNGVLFSGTEGTAMILPEDNYYEAWNLDNKLIREQDKSDLENEQPSLTGVVPKAHFKNFIDAIRDDEDLHAPVANGAISNSLCHYGNIAQELDRTLRVDSTTGKILDDKEAASHGTREYEPGWRPQV